MLHIAPLLWYLAALNLYIGRTSALLPSGVIFPLYIYPGTGCAAWSDVTSQIQSHGIVPFYIIINPASGPGGPPGSQPDTTYQACIANLRATGSVGGNVKILGYVATGNGTNPSSTVMNDIDAYSRWSSAYRPDGIFFDEVATAASFLTAYQSFASRVHLDFGTSFIVLNPGTKPDPGYFNIPDMIVTFEGFYDDFDASQLAIGPTTPSRKQAVILHDGPAQIPFEIVDELASIIDVGASFITDFPNAIAYENIPSDWSNFCNDLISAQTA